MLQASRGSSRHHRRGTIRNLTLQGIKDSDWTAYHNIDLTHLDSLVLHLSGSRIGGTIEIRVSYHRQHDSSKNVESATNNASFGRGATIPVIVNTLGITGPQDLYFLYREPESESIDKETLKEVASADMAIIFVGTDQNTGREESDRFSLSLPGNQMQLIQSVAAVNPNTVVVMQTMGMVEVEDIKNNSSIPGLIFTGYNGQAQGPAMAKILFGEVNPVGKAV